MTKSWLFWALITTVPWVSFAVNADQKRDNKPTTIQFTSTLPSKGDLVLGIYENGDLGTYAQSIDKKTKGGLAHAIKATEFEAKMLTSQLITAPMDSGYQQILLIGLGEASKERTDLDWQNIGGDAVQKAVDAFETAPTMAFSVSSNAAAQIAYGAKLGSYYFDKYYTDEKRHKYQKSISIVTANVQETNRLYSTELDPVANAIWYTRDVSNEPANVIYPESFVAYWQELFKGMDNIKIRVYDEQEIVEKGMGALYGVGQGSKRPPRMMIVEYLNSNRSDAPVVLVGKGITFDTGGISLKNPPNLWNMKFDMSGAASTMGTLYALAGRNAKVNVVGIAALAENMPSSKAQRPGDVVKSMSGKTIQIRSTDAEGRLVLADGMYYGDTVYNPSLIIDLATLTGSASRALGKDYAALFTRHEELTPKFIEMGKKTGDEVWPLPLNKNHFKAIENKVADVMNSGPDAPGASAGAAFVGAFVRETTPWVHFDIAGVAWGDKTNPTKGSPGSTSFGVRLLNGYIKEHFEK